MSKILDIEQELVNEKNPLTKEEQLLLEAKQVLIQSRLTEKNILDNLNFYKSSFEFLDEEDIDVKKIFSIHQIKSTAIKLRLRFLPSQAFEGEIPYEAVLKIKELNSIHRKELKHFKILSTKEFFSSGSKDQSMLFAQTLFGNYYHLHSWGNTYKGNRKIKMYPLRKFESFAVCILLITLIECLILPTRFLTTDWRATYFSLYRAAAYFHLLILNAGFLVFLMFGFHCNFSEQIWDTAVKRKKL